MLEAVIFDMDGVMIDSEPLHYKTEKEILEGFGVTDYPFSEHAQYVGMRTRDLWKGHCQKYNLTKTPEELTIIGDDAYIEELKTGDFGPIEGVMELIQSINESGKKLIVASSASRENIRLVLDKFAISNYFLGYVSSQDVKLTKPNPDIFLLAAKTLKVKPENCVVIEDASHGVAAAKSAGMACIAYRNMNSGNQDLTKADAIVDSLYDVDLEMMTELSELLVK